MAEDAAAAAALAALAAAVAAVAAAAELLHAHPCLRQHDALYRAKQHLHNSDR